jgi:ubiquitin-conjugating enzyme E2 D/E
MPQRVARAPRGQLNPEAQPAKNSKRLQIEKRDYENDCPHVRAGIAIHFPVVEVTDNWTATLDGPRGSVYEGGKFNVSISFPPDYPFKPPRVRFMTRIYHPHVNSAGAIAMDTLSSMWSPALSVFRVLVSLQSFMLEPVVRDQLGRLDVLVPEIGKQYLRNRAEFNATATEWTRKHAKADDSVTRTSEAAKKRARLVDAPQRRQLRPTASRLQAAAAARQRLAELHEP